MMNALVWNVAILLFVPPLWALLFSKKGESGVTYILMTWLIVCLSVTAWIVFTVVHFLGKVW